MLSLYLLAAWRDGVLAAHRVCGQIDARLTADGHRMAAAFSRTPMAIFPGARLYSSRVRTLETALPLAASTGLPITPDRRLDEISFGRWHGLSKDEAAATDPEHYARWLCDPARRPAWWRDPGGGSGAGFGGPRRRERYDGGRLGRYREDGATGAALSLRRCGRRPLPRAVVLPGGLPQHHRPRRPWRVRSAGRRCESPARFAPVLVTAELEGIPPMLGGDEAAAASV